MALFKKGKKTGMKGKKTKGRPYGSDAVQGEGYNEMLTPRNDMQQMQNMERVDEDQEEDQAAHDESQ